MRKIKLVIGIPAHNEEATIGKVIARALKSSNSILVVDDGSRDDTALIAKSMGATVISHPRKIGKGAGLRECLKWARRVRADVLVTLDADAQHDAYQISRLVDKLVRSQADVVVGSRSSRPKDMPAYRWMGGRTIDSASGVKIGDRVPDTQSGFRAYSRRAIHELDVTEYGMGADTEILVRAARAGMKILEVPTVMSYAGYNKGIRKSASHGLDVTFSIIKFAAMRHPFTVFGGFAAASLAISLIFGLIAIDYYHRYGQLITNLALISLASGIVGLLSIFTGVILFTVISVVREDRVTHDI